MIEPFETLTECSGSGYKGFAEQGRALHPGVEGVVVSTFF